MPLKLTRAVSCLLNGGGRGTVNSNDATHIDTGISSSQQCSVSESVNTITTTITNSGNVNTLLKDESCLSPPTQVTLPPPSPLGKVVASSKRRATSLDMNTRDNIFAEKNNGRNSGSKSSWYKSLASKLNQTWKWSSSSATNTINSSSNNITVRPLLQQWEKQDDVNSTTFNNRQEKGQSENHHHQGNNEILECEKGSKESSSLAILETGEGHVGTLKSSTLESKKQSTSSRRDPSLFEIYAQTPRHFTSEPEVLGKVGRFTVVRESESFTTAVFDRCHCATKPCPYAELDKHPPAPESTVAVDGSRWSLPQSMTPNTTSSSIFSTQNSSTHSLPTVIQPAHQQQNSALRRHSSQQQQRQQQHISNQLNGTFANSLSTSQSGQRPKRVFQSGYSSPSLHPKRSLQLRQQELRKFSSSSSAPVTPSSDSPNFLSPNINDNIPINNSNTCSSQFRYSSPVPHSASSSDLYQLHRHLINDENQRRRQQRQYEETIVLSPKNSSSSISSAHNSNRQSRFIVEKSSTSALQTQQQKRSSLYSLNNLDSTSPSNCQQHDSPSLSVSPPLTASSQPHTKVCLSGRKFELEWGGSVDWTSVSRSSTLSSVVSTATTNTTSNNSSPGTSFSSYTSSFSSADNRNSIGAVAESVCKGRRKFEVTVLASDSGTTGPRAGGSF